MSNRSERRPGPTSLDELLKLQAPLTIGEFWTAFSNRLAEDQGQHVSQDRRRAARHRNVLLVRLAQSAFDAEGKAVALELDEDDRQRLVAASVSFANVATTWFRREMDTNYPSSTPMLTREDARCLPLPPYLVCEAVALYVARRGDETARLDPSMGQWFFPKEEESGPTRQEWLWSRLLAHSEHLCAIARRHDPSSGYDEEEVSWTRDVLDSLRVDSDEIVAAVAEMARSIDTMMRSNPRADSKQLATSLSDSAENVEAYLWRRCGVSTVSIRKLLASEEAGGSEHWEAVPSSHVENVVGAAKRILTNPNKWSEKKVEDRKRVAKNKPARS